MTKKAKGAQGQVEPRPQSQEPLSHGHVIHHLWVNLGAVKSAFMPELELRCLGSWQPMEQWLWTYDLEAAEPMAADIKGLHCKDAAQLVEPGVALSLLASGVPIQIFKDMFSMRVLAEHGGVWADLDVFWLGKPLPIHGSGYTFALEPHTRPAGQFMGRKSPRAHLGLFAMPKKAPLAMDMYQKWFLKWRAWAMKQDPSHPFNWKSEDGWHRWMDNTNMFSNHALKLAKTKSGEPCVVQQPWVFMPLALTFMGLTDIDMAMETTSSSASPPVIDCAQPYPSPTVADMALHSCTVNLWTRQLEPHVQAKLMEVLMTLRWTALNKHTPELEVPLNDPGHDKVDAVTAAINEFRHDVLEVMGMARGHQLLAYAHCLATHPFVSALLRTGGRSTTAAFPGDGGYPQAVCGIGPWRGREPTASVWASLFLWMGVRLCHRDPRAFWSEYDADPDGLCGVFVPGPGIQPQHGPAQDKLRQLMDKFFNAHIISSRSASFTLPGNMGPATVVALEAWFSTVKPEAMRLPR